MAGYIGSKASVTQVDGYNTTEADAEFVQVSGDTMTGDLTVSGSFTSLGIDDNATSTAMTLDSSGNLLVGTTSSSGKVGIKSDVNQGGDSTALTLSQGNYSNGGTTLIKLGTEGNGWSKGAIGFERTGNFDTGSLIFCTNPSADTADVTSADERMRIDAAGRVTMPYQPIASYSDTRAINLTNVDLTSSNFYNTQFVNRGNHFSTSTGRFTCPVAGVYRVMWRHTEEANANVRIYKNGATVSEAFSLNQGSHNSVSAFAVVNCAVNDYLSIQVADFQTLGGTQHKLVSFELVS